MLIWAKAYFSAAHSLPQHPEIHGHSYEVRAYVDYGCAEALQARLREVLSRFDHRNLNDYFAEPTMEAIAHHVAEKLDAKRVLVERPVEGLGAEWP